MIKMLFTGDFCPIGPVEQIVLNGDLGRIVAIFEDVLPVAKQSDYLIVNLECPLTLSQSPIEKAGPNLRADSKTVVLMKNLGVDLAAMANNHIYDQGLRGLKDTLETCRAHGIATVGAGETLADAQQFHVATIKGKSIAFVNFAENEFGNATSKRGGANPLDIVDNTRQIKLARQEAEAVIVIIHGGHEHFHYPSPRMVKTYRFFAEQGATAIIAHHPHCISGYEIYGGVPIFYSLGNFLFSLDRDFPGWHTGYMVQLQIESTGNLKFSIIPYSQCKESISVRLLKDIDHVKFKKELDDLSSPIATSELLIEIWENYAKQRGNSYAYSLSPMSKQIKQVLGKLGASRFFLPRLYMLNLLNHLRCESHRDLMLQSLSKWIEEN